MKSSILLASLVLVVVLSGCIEQDTELIHYSDDIITIEDYYVSNKNPYPNSPVVIEFVVQNNGEEKVPRVEVGFPNYPGFDPTSFELVCEGAEAIDKDNDSNGVKEVCLFDENSEYGEIEPQDSRRILLTLNTIDSNPISPKTYTIYYYVEYEYSGFRKFDVPVIDNTLKDNPSSEYSQSSATYGPIKLEFALPSRGEKVVDGKTVKEYWGTKGIPFTVKMSFEDVGSSSIGSVRDTVIEAGGINLDLRDSLSIATDSKGNILNCDFIEDNGKLYSDEKLEVPDTMDCIFIPTDFSDPETTASIWAEYGYKYHYELSEQFELQPK